MRSRGFPRADAGVNIQVLRSKGLDDADWSAYRLRHWLEKGAFDALSKKYLSRLILNIHSANPDEPGAGASVLESYAFKLAYAQEEDAEAEEGCTAELTATTSSSGKKGGKGQRKK